MVRYRVEFIETVTTIVYVEAESKEDARRRVEAKWKASGYDGRNVEADEILVCVDRGGGYYPEADE